MTEPQKQTAQPAESVEGAALKAALQEKINGKTKPTGSLGMLEKIALQAGLVWGTLTPEIHHPHIVVFAADHGITVEGVSAYPQEVTAQMVLNFVQGGAAINVFCRQHGIQLLVVDAGVKTNFDPALPVINQKTGRGTRSFRYGAAMDKRSMEKALEQGRQTVRQIAQAGCNLVGFGEMGIGNTSSAAVLMSRLCNFPLDQCIGRGTGVDDKQFARKHLVLRQAVDAYEGTLDPAAVLAWFGGFEIVQMAGAMLEAYRQRMLILVDGFISTVAFLCALKMEPGIREHAIFSHLSGEQGHRRLLEYLGAEPLLQLDLRLGEGTGCAVAFPLIKSALAFLAEMASFESAGVSNKV